MVMEVQPKLNAGGFWMNAVRNTLGDWLSPKNGETSGFVASIETKIEDTVCGYWNKATGNAQKVLTKLNSEKQSQTVASSTTAIPAIAGTTAVFPTGK